MSVDPNQDPNQSYGGYGGYTPPSQPDDPYAGQQGYQGYYQQQQQQGTGYQQGGYQQSSYGQQQQYYEPPRSASSRISSGAFDATSLHMDAKNEAVLSYLFWWLSGLVFFLIERKNSFVRFAAAQSFILLGGAFVLIVLFRLLTLVPLIGFVLSPALTCAFFVVLIPAVLLWIFLMVQARRGIKVKLPIVGEYAERLVNRFSKPRTV
ncbi:MAG TPA: hypothetical protein VKV37_18695 [Ktedonobacteraceae bacterium]|jgi:uncharacterized membrane protein|nr:hypothetical protein [Ktedonobacteraceae bacterium]